MEHDQNTDPISEEAHTTSVGEGEGKTQKLIEALDRIVTEHGVHTVVLSGTPYRVDTSTFYAPDDQRMREAVERLREERQETEDE